MKIKRTKKKSLFRKFIKIFLWFGVVVTFLFILTFSVIRIKYPPERVKELTKEQISKAINHRHVSIAEVSINPLKGFIVENIIIYDQALLDSALLDSTKFISIDKVNLKYKLSSLLRKTIKINEISFDHPEVYLTFDKQYKSNFEDIITASEKVEQDSARTPEDTTASAFNLPVSFELDKFDFKNLDTYISFVSDSTRINAQLVDFSIFIEDLLLPSGTFDSIKTNAKAFSYSCMV